MTLTNPNLEGYNIVRNMWIKYYNKHQRTFIAPKKCSGCYNNEKFVIWAVSVAAQAVVDGARIYKELVPLVDPAIMIFQKYKNPHLKGYSAAENNGNDKDIYYDDDAQVCSAMLTAYEVTGDLKYLDQGRELTRFLMGGWNDNPNAKNKGGVKWHINNAYLNACTTAEVAKCCLQIAKFIPNEAKVYIDFAAKCIDWQIKTLQDPDDKLIKDGIQDTADHPNDTKWTYNVGTTLSAAAHLYHYTKDEHWKQIADDLADAAIHRNRTCFYDRDYDMGKRYWRDSSYFVQLLIEGLSDYLLFVGPDAPGDLPKRIEEEIKRHLVMFYEYMRDPEDGLYIQSFEPHHTYREVYDTKYKKEFGTRKGWSLKDEDKSGDKPQKCLMGCASAARVFFQGARAVPKIE